MDSLPKPGLGRQFFPAKPVYVESEAGNATALASFKLNLFGDLFDFTPDAPKLLANLPLFSLCFYFNFLIHELLLHRVSYLFILAESVTESLLLHIYSSCDGER